MFSTEKPKGRCQDLVTQDVSDEVLIYDVRTKRAHHLNPTAAFVWKCCDGKNTLADIRKKYESETHAPVADEVIWLAIDQLSERDLLAAPIDVTFPGMSRRDAIRKISVATLVGLPIIGSLAVPVAAQSASACVSPACTCVLVAPCTAVGGCLCSSQANCPELCTGGCTCTVIQGTTSCNSVCQE